MEALVKGLKAKQVRWRCVSGGRSFVLPGDGGSIVAQCVSRGFTNVGSMDVSFVLYDRGG